MEKEDENYSEEAGVMVDYVIPPHEHHNQQQHHLQHQQLLLEPGSSMNVSASSDRGLSFADVMQFADFGPKLALHRPHDEHHGHAMGSYDRVGDSTGAVDPINFLKFPVLNKQLILSGAPGSGSQNDNEGVGHFIYDLHGNNNNNNNNNDNNDANIYNNPVQLEFMGNAAGNSTDNNIVEPAGEMIGQANLDAGAAAGKGTKRKRPRTVKTSEEVESQRMTHIAVERNRRKQMNEHLRVLRSLMPSSYVQRGDQASIIGGAIEFVRELEQLLQCLESQKRRRLYGDQAAGPSTPSLSLVQQPPLGFPPSLQTTPSGAAIVPAHYQDDQMRPVEMDPNNCLWEDTAESKSSIADVEVKMSGFNALIKILSRRRPGQLIKLIADLEDLHFSILHTNITTIEQTVLYSFNVQVSSEARFTADDIASSVQQIFTFIHVNTSII